MKQLTLSRYVLLGTLMLTALAVAAFVRIGGANAEDGSIPPVISNIIVTPAQTGATITWNTDQSSDSQIYYGETASYNASSTLDTSTTTSHASFLGGLTASTTYHFQIRSANASSTVGTSTDMTFTTLAATTTASTTPVISNIVSTPTVSGATITWSTDLATSSQVKYGTTSSYGSQSTLDNTAVMSHSVALSALTPSTLYHFQILSGNATSGDLTFTTLMSTSSGTSTATSTSPTSEDINNLIDKLHDLQEKLAAINAQLMNALSILAGWSPGTTTPPTDTGGATISPVTRTVSAGSSIDFGGHGFGHEETVNILRNGAVVGSAHADGGGNFSTGSMNIPGPAGTYTYQFIGQTSGYTASATITVP